MKKVKNALKSHRKHLRLTLEQVSKVSGYSIGYHSQVERGLTNLPDYALYDFSLAYQVTKNRLLSMIGG